MTPPLLYVTGTNTGVGKTTLCSLLLRRARERSLVVAAMKPFCSGGREDAVTLHSLQTSGSTLDEVNPFYFEEPVTPYVAARTANQQITAQHASNSIERVRSKNLPMLIEGAGGLLSPLGERFTLLDLMHDTPGKICIVGANVLGVINAALLTHRALSSFSDVRFVLMSPAEPDASTSSNPDVIREWTKAPVFEFPFLASLDEQNIHAIAVLDSLLDWWLATE